MARTKDLHVEERNRRLVADVTQDRFQSYSDLGRKHGMTEQMVYRILADHSLISRERAKPRLKMSDRKPISNFHVLVGAAIEAHFNEVTLDRQDEGKIGKLAQWLSMSPQRVGGVLKGVDDLSLSELIKVSKWINIPLGDFLTLCAAKENRYRLPARLDNTGS